MAENILLLFQRMEWLLLGVMERKGNLGMEDLIVSLNQLWLISMSLLLISKQEDIIHHSLIKTGISIHVEMDPKDSLDSVNVILYSIQLKSERM